MTPQTEPLTNQEIFEHQQREVAWRKTPIGAAFTKFKSAYSRAWIVDTEATLQDSASPKRLREVWETAETAEHELRVLLDAKER